MREDVAEWPSLAIVVPTFRRPAHIQRLLQELIPQALAVNAAVVVVNDGSHDERYAVALEPYLHAVQYEVLDRNVGRGAATNHGISRSQADWVVFTDDDIVPSPDWLETLAGIIRRFPMLDAVGGTTRALERTDAGVVERFTVRRGTYVPQPHFTNGTLKCLVTACLAVRRETLDAVGGLDDSFPCGQDHNLTWRLRRYGAAIHTTHRWWCGHDQAWSLSDFTRRLREYGYWHVMQSEISHDPVDYEANPATSWRQLWTRLPSEIRQLGNSQRYVGLSFADRQRFRFLDLAAFTAWHSGGLAAGRHLDKVIR